MAQLVLHLQPRATSGAACACCGRPLPAAGGPQLALADRPDGVCRDCGKQHAPSLVALLDLAHAAERVGRISRHTVCPPMTALLDLAHAAEYYTTATAPRGRRRAA